MKRRRHLTPPGFGSTPDVEDQTVHLSSYALVVDIETFITTILRPGLSEPASSSSESGSAGISTFTPFSRGRWHVAFPPPEAPAPNTQPAGPHVAMRLATVSKVGCIVDSTEAAMPSPGIGSRPATAHGVRLAGWGR